MILPDVDCKEGSRFCRCWLVFPLSLLKRRIAWFNSEEAVSCRLAAIFNSRCGVPSRKPEFSSLARCLFIFLPFSVLPVTFCTLPFCLFAWCLFAWCLFAWCLFACCLFAWFPFVLYLSVWYLLPWSSFTSFDSVYFKFDLTLFT